MMTPEIDRKRAEHLPGRNMSFGRIRQSLPTKPVSAFFFFPFQAYRKSFGVRVLSAHPRLIPNSNAPSYLQLTSYDSPTGTDSTNLGWVRPGDPRSELVLSLFKEGNGLRVMLNGLSPTALATPPPSAKVQAISPMAQLKAGRYKVPTFIIHADRDEIAPFKDSQAFIEELKREGVRGELGRVPGKGHIHDLALKPGGRGWEEGVGVGYSFVFDIIAKLK